MALSIIPFLHLEIITEILLKLPPKSLIKFKCVSKSWLQLISSPKFVKSHLKLAASDNEYSYHRFMYRDSQDNFKVSCLPSLFCKETSSELFDMDPPLEKPFVSYWTVDSVNGLVCFFIGMEGFLWNPTIRKCKKLPKLKRKIKSGYSCYCHCGFGYDKSLDDYKVVVIHCISKLKGGSYATVVNIYSLRRGYWKSVDKFQGYFMRNYSGKYVNGNFYWASCASSAGIDRHEVSNIISLDLVDETWGKLELPSFGEGKTPSLSILGVVGSDLSLLCTCHGGTAFDVWIMKDCGHVSWTKLFTIKYPQQHLKRPMEYFSTKMFSYSKHFCLANKGEILLLVDEIIMMYNPYDGSIRQLEFPGFKEAFAPEPEIYVESLVDPLLIANWGLHNHETSRSFG